jgi:hypothetical protein
MTDPRSNLTRLAALEALSNQHQNLVETIARPLEIMKSIPEGELRAKLLDEISCLNVTA